jgi:hypothetical protein
MQMYKSFRSIHFPFSLSFSFFAARREYLLKFDDKFEVQDDFEVLKRMGLLLGKFEISEDKKEINWKYLKLFRNGQRRIDTRRY